MLQFFIMKLYKYTAFLLLSSGLIFAQNQKFTMSEAVNGLRSNLAVKNYSQASWLKGSNSVSYLSNKAYFTTDAKSNKTDTLLSLSRLNKGVSKENDYKALPSVKFKSATSGYFKKGNVYYTLEKSGKKKI